MPGWNFEKDRGKDRKRQGTVVCLKKDGLNSLNIEPREHHRAPKALACFIGDAFPLGTSRNEPLVSELPDGFRWTCELYSKTRAFLNELRIDGAA